MGALGTVGVLWSTGGSRRVLVPGCFQRTSCLSQSNTAWGHPHVSLQRLQLNIGWGHPHVSLRWVQFNTAWGPPPREPAMGPV